LLTALVVVALVCVSLHVSDAEAASPEDFLVTSLPGYVHFPPLFSSSPSSSSFYAHSLWRGWGGAHGSNQEGRALPFRNYAGYITVDAARGRRLFFWLAESQSNPSTDPVHLLFVLAGRLRADDELNLH
jgi:hypothetical protein